ncbi:hypothetical protein SOVF_189220 [Spinacia oleracea]|nr:hypothetical protein SOVF_189220 [Spinacia oleracea]
MASSSRMGITIPYSEFDTPPQSEKYLLSVVGKIKDYRSFSEAQIQQWVNQFWTTNGPIIVGKVGQSKEFFFFFCNNIYDRDNLLAVGTASYKGALVIFKGWAVGGSIPSMDFSEANFWIKVEGIPTPENQLHVAGRLLDRIGRIIKFDEASREDGPKMVPLVTANREVDYGIRAIGGLQFDFIKESVAAAPLYSKRIMGLEDVERCRTSRIHIREFPEESFGSTIGDDDNNGNDNDGNDNNGSYDSSKDDNSEHPPSPPSPPPPDFIGGGDEPPVDRKRKRRDSGQPVAPCLSIIKRRGLPPVSIVIPGRLMQVFNWALAAGNGPVNGTGQREGTPFWGQKLPQLPALMIAYPMPATPSQLHSGGAVFHSPKVSLSNSINDSESTDGHNSYSEKLFLFSNPTAYLSARSTQLYATSNSTLIECPPAVSMCLIFSVQTGAYLDCIYGNPPTSFPTPLLQIAHKTHHIYPFIQTCLHPTFPYTLPNQETFRNWSNPTNYLYIKTPPPIMEITPFLSSSSLPNLEGPIQLTENDRLSPLLPLFLDPLRAKNLNASSWAMAPGIQFGSIPNPAPLPILVPSPKKDSTHDWQVISANPLSFQKNSNQSSLTLESSFTPYLLLPSSSQESSEILSSDSTPHPNSPVSLNSFATAPSSLHSEEVEALLNIKMMGLDSDSSNSFGSEIEPEYYDHEVKKEIYRKRRANRMDENGPRRKQWRSGLLRELQGRTDGNEALKRVGTPPYASDHQRKRVKAQFKYAGKGKMKFGLSGSDDLWEKLNNAEEDLDAESDNDQKKKKAVPIHRSTHALKSRRVPLGSPLKEQLEEDVGERAVPKTVIESDKPVKKRKKKQHVTGNQQLENTIKMDAPKSADDIVADVESNDAQDHKGMSQGEELHGELSQDPRLEVSAVLTELMLQLEKPQAGKHKARKLDQPSSIDTSSNGHNLLGSKKKKGSAKTSELQKSASDQIHDKTVPSPSTKEVNPTLAELTNSTRKTGVPRACLDDWKQVF